MKRFLVGLLVGGAGAAATSTITDSVELIGIVGVGLALVVWLRIADFLFDVTEALVLALLRAGD
jgi:hypothetical protein